MIIGHWLSRKSAAPTAPLLPQIPGPRKGLLALRCPEVVVELQDQEVSPASEVDPMVPWSGLMNPLQNHCKQPSKQRPILQVPLKKKLGAIKPLDCGSAKEPRQGGLEPNKANGRGSCVSPLSSP